MELEVQQHLGAGRHERTAERQRGSATGTGSGAGTRGWGRSSCAVPRVRDGSFFPGLLEPRPAGRAGAGGGGAGGVRHGVSTRRVDELVKALGMAGISKSQVVAPVPGAGRRGRALPGAAAGRPPTRTSGWTPRS